MRAKIIHNPSLTISAEGVFSVVKDNLAKYSKHIIIVPERQTLISEKQLLKVLGKRCSFECEVISINRLCNRVFGIGEVLDKQGGTMLVQKILQEKAKELVFFRSMERKLGFAENLYQTIMQFKSSGVSPEDIEVKEEKTLFNLKMQDIKLIFAEYEKYIEMGYTDGAFKLERLRQEIKSNKFFENTAFYFAYFESFTYHELQIVNDLIEHNNFCVVGCRYSRGSRNEHIFTNLIYEQMQGIFFEKGLNDIEEYKVVLPSVFEGIKENLFAYSPKSQLNFQNKVRLFCAKSPTEEVRAVLNEIYYLVKQKGFRFKDINVAVAGLGDYKAIFEKELSAYSFSAYFDLSVTLLDTELGKFITSMLECVHYGFMSADVFVLINNQYFGLNDRQTDLVNLFLRRYSFQGLKKLINFEVIQKDEKFLKYAEETGEDFKEVLTLTHEKLMKIKESFAGVKSGVNFAENLTELLNGFEVEKVTEEIINANSNDLFAVRTNEQVLGKIQKLLNQILDLEIFNDYSCLEFSQILKTGLEASKINLVPLSVDSIFIGDAQESTFEKKKVMFIVGAVAGRLPQVKDDVGLVVDREIDALSSRFILEPKVSEINMRNRLKAFELCLLSTDLLFVYYPETSEASENLKPSQVFVSLSKCFHIEENEPLFVNSCEFNLINIEKEDEEGLFEKLGSLSSAQKTLLENKEQSNFIRYATIKSSIDDLNDKQGFKACEELEFKMPLIKNLSKYCFRESKKGGRLTSFTQISEYLSCPFKHFAKRALKIEEIEKVGINQLDIGNILHAYAESFVNDLIQNKNTTFNEKVLIDETEKIENKIKKDFEQVFKNEENSLVLKGILKEGKKLIKQLNAEYSKTNFMPYACELKFNDFKISESESAYYLSGSIDRVDKFENYYSIIDYKTGSATLEIKDIYYGAKLQLPLYSVVLNSKISDSFVIGFGYYPIKDKFLDITKNPNNSYKINGCYIENELFLENLDFDLKELQENGKVTSSTYSFSKSILKTTGGTKYDGTISKEDFSALIEYSKAVINQAIKEIELGFIEAKPAKENRKSACDYCEYASLCNKELFGKERKLKSIKMQTIKEALSGISTNTETERNTRD